MFDVIYLFLGNNECDWMCVRIYRLWGKCVVVLVDSLGIGRRGDLLSCLKEYDFGGMVFGSWGCVV